MTTPFTTLYSGDRAINVAYKEGTPSNMRVYPDADTYDIVGQLYAPRVYGRNLTAFEVASSGIIAMTMQDTHALDIDRDAATSNVILRTVAGDGLLLSLTSSNTAYIQLGGDSNITVSAGSNIYMSGSNVNITASNFLVQAGDSNFLSVTPEAASVLSGSNMLVMTPSNVSLLSGSSMTIASSDSMSLSSSNDLLMSGSNVNITASNFLVQAGDSNFLSVTPEAASVLSGSNMLVMTPSNVSLLSGSNMTIASSDTMSISSCNDLMLTAANNLVINACNLSLPLSNFNMESTGNMNLSGASNVMVRGGCQVIIQSGSNYLAVNPLQAVMYATNYSTASINGGRQLQAKTGQFVVNTIKPPVGVLGAINVTSPTTLTIDATTSADLLAAFQSIPAGSMFDISTPNDTAYDSVDLTPRPGPGTEARRRGPRAPGPARPGDLAEEQAL